jgi:hypothetical protein
MKIATIIHPARGLFIVPFLVFCLALPPQQAQAQDSSYLGNSYMDEHDRQQLNQVYEIGQSDTVTSWVNPDTGNSYNVTPKAAYTGSMGQPCREAHIDAIINGKPETVVTNACRAPDGMWELEDEIGSALESSEKYSREELAQLLAPIALYPDALLSQILMASTYPIEVIEADRWVRNNPGLTGDDLDTVLLDKDWDYSVKAMCHFPSILALMSERITDTTNLGNAFLAQEPEVMDMVQELRAKAYAAGNLTTTSKQKVIVEEETIIIKSADPRVIYVPYYDPFYVYGPWWYPAYPPYYWGPSGVRVGIGISYWPGFYFGFVFGDWSYFDWPRRYIYIEVHKRPRFVRHDRWVSVSDRWHHHPRHRRSVAYRDKSTALKYGQYPRRSRDVRRETRGFPEPRVQERRDDRTRIDRDRQRQRYERDRQDRARIERDSQERIQRERQERERVDRDRQDRARTDRNRQVRQRVDKGKQVQERVEREKLQRRHDNVFNRIEDGRRERLSSERGRSSRQGRGGDPRGRGRPDNDDRDDWRRNRR